MRLLAVLAAAPAALAGGTARVRLTDESPVTVAGTGFRAAERVTVTVTAGTVVLRKNVSATAAGRFVARWRRSVGGECRSTTVTAVGNRGSAASWKSLAVDCAPPPSE